MQTVCLGEAQCSVRNYSGNFVGIDIETIQI
jgi:hypothetical protein